MSVSSIWVSSGGGGGLLKNICTLYAPQKEETQSPTYQKSMKNPVLGERNSILNRVFKLDNSNFLNFNLVFACICNGKDI